MDNLENKIQENEKDIQKSQEKINDISETPENEIPKNVLKNQEVLAENHKENGVKEVKIYFKDVELTEKTINNDLKNEKPTEFTEGTQNSSEIKDTANVYPTGVDENYKNMTFLKKLTFLRKNITIEPVIFCFIMANALAMLNVQTMNLQKACKVNMNYSDEVCTALVERRIENYTEEEVQVQTLVAQMTVWKTVIFSVLSAISCVLLGSWSDRTGRRITIVIITVSGDLIMYLSFLMSTYYFNEWSMEVNGLLETIVPAMAGSKTSFFMAVFSYLADISTEESRTARIGIVKMFLFLGLFVGISLSGVMYQLIGYYGIFSLSSFINIIGISYALIFLKESNLQNPSKFKNQNDSKSSGCFEFVDPRNFMETLKIFTKKRAGNQRLILILIFITYCVFEGPVFGEFTVEYLFTRYAFHWNEVSFSIYKSYSIIIHLTASFVTVSVFSSWLHLSDILIAMIAFTGRIGSNIIYSFCSSPTYYYLAHCIELVTMGGSISTRSIASKVIESNEQGKLNALIGLIEAVMPILFNSIYNFVYVSTISWFPGGFLILTATLSSPGIFLLLWIRKLQKIPDAIP